MRLTDKRFCFFEIIAVLLPLVLVIGFDSITHPVIDVYVDLCMVVPYLLGGIISWKIWNGQKGLVLSIILATVIVAITVLALLLSFAVDKNLWHYVDWGVSIFIINMFIPNVISIIALGCIGGKICHTKDKKQEAISNKI